MLCSAPTFPPLTRAEGGRVGAGLHGVSPRLQPPCVSRRQCACDPHWQIHDTAFAQPFAAGTARSLFSFLRCFPSCCWFSASYGWRLHFSQARVRSYSTSLLRAWCSSPVTGHRARKFCGDGPLPYLQYLIRRNSFPVTFLYPGFCSVHYRSAVSDVSPRILFIAPKLCVRWSSRSALIQFEIGRVQKSVYNHRHERSSCRSN